MTKFAYTLCLLFGSLLLNAQNPQFLSDINTGAANGAVGNKVPTVFSGSLFFSGTDGSTAGIEVWKSDGINTTLLTDATIGGDSRPHTFISTSNYLFFATDPTAGQAGFWRTDGSAPGTILLATVDVDVTSIDTRSYAWMGNNLYFVGSNNSSGKELWKTDGTPAGTMMVKDIASGSSGSDPINFTVMNNTLYFAAFTQTLGYELWKSDGTSNGTTIIRDIRVSFESSSPEYLTIYNNEIYFAASDIFGDRELWKSDGTHGGTVEVKDLHPSMSSNPTEIAMINNALYFIATSPTMGKEVWKSDGTSAGTVVLKDIMVGTASCAPERLFGWNNEVFFSAEDANGRHLFRSDGSAAGTNPVGSLVGNQSANKWLMNATKLYFVAEDGVGEALWVTDWNAGTTNKVLRFSDLSLTLNSAFAWYNGSLHFEASHPNYGSEIWRFNPNSGVLSIANLASEVTQLGKVYPSPNQGAFTVELNAEATTQLSILDASGRIILERQLEGQQQLQVQLSEVPAGLYFVRLNQGQQQQVLSFVKE